MFKLNWWLSILLFDSLFLKLITCTTITSRVLKELWKKGEKCKLYIYKTYEPIQDTFEESDLLLVSDVVYGELRGKSTFLTRSMSVEELSKGIKEDKVLFIHIYLVKEGYAIDPTLGKFSIDALTYKRMEIAYRNSNGKYCVYPYLDISLVFPSINHINLEDNPRYATRQLIANRERTHFYPIIYLNEFWRVKDREVEVSKVIEKSKIDIYITVNGISWTYLVWLTHFNEVFKQPQFKDNSAMSMSADTIKLMFLENGPFILILTLIVSIIHIVFEFLAFKNDIQFWRKKNDLKGLSMQGVLLNALGQFLIFLYLVDQGTNHIITASVFIGFLIEMWKLTKVINVKFGPFIQEISLNKAYFQSKTSEYDWLAMKHLGKFIIPLMLTYSWYSFKSHKSIYSSIIETLVGFVYAFGFIMMTPQLFINYKMKSVSHMPWRVFVYRALNTFIDDLFAFIIRMPTIHRIACLRDDVVFVIYLYQRWIYPIDKNRTEEVGGIDHDSFCIQEKRNETKKMK